MKTHPVPQNIMDVEFKLFGDLTIRQFGYVAGGAVVAFFFYLIFPDIPIIRWPLVIFFGLLGIMLALFKVNDRPFEVWLANFIYSLFTSQRKVWKKSNETPQILRNQPDRDYSSKTSVSVNKLPLSSSYLVSDKVSQSLPDVEEDERLKNLSVLMSGDTPQKKSNQDINSFIQRNEANKELKQEEIEEKVELKQEQRELPKKQVHYSNIDNILPDKFDKTELLRKMDKIEDSSEDMTDQITREKTQSVTTEFDTDKSEIVSKTRQVDPEYLTRLKSELVEQNKLINKYRGKDSEKTENITLPKGARIVDSTTMDSKVVEEKIKNEFSKEENLVSHTKANILIGEVKGKNLKGISQATVIIKNSKYVPVRALKTNSVGKFSITTPLENGEYSVEASKPGYEFDSVDFSLDGTCSKYLEIIEI